MLVSTPSHRLLLKTDLDRPTCSVIADARCVVLSQARFEIRSVEVSGERALVGGVRGSDLREDIVGGEECLSDECAPCDVVLRAASVQSLLRSSAPAPLTATATMIDDHERAVQPVGEET